MYVLLFLTIIFCCCITRYLQKYQIRITGYLYKLVWKKGHINTGPTTWTDRVARLLYKSHDWSDLRLYKPICMRSCLDFDPADWKNDRPPPIPRVKVLFFFKQVQCIARRKTCQIGQILCKGVYKVGQMALKGVWKGMCIAVSMAWRVFKFICKSLCYLVLELSGIMMAYRILRCLLYPLRLVWYIITHPTMCLFWILLIGGYDYLFYFSNTVRLILFVLWISILSKLFFSPRN